jgi:MFS family permease
MPDATPDIAPSARALLKERDYLFFWGSRWCGTFAAQIESVALGWQMYALARRSMSVEQSAFLVGMIGLAAFVPVFLLTLPAGETADRYERRKVMLACLAGEMVSAFVLTLAAWRGFATPALLLGVAVLFGASRAFFSPANTAMGPMLVPRELLPRSIAWNSLAWQTASIAGPAAGGLLVAISPAHAFVTALILYAGSALCVAAVRKSTKPETQPGSRQT